MNKTGHQQNKELEKLSFFDHVAEWIGWLQIAASPILGGLIVGGAIYLWVNNTAGTIAGVSIAVLGLVAA